MSSKPSKKVDFRTEEMRQIKAEEKRWGTSRIVAQFRLSCAAGTNAEFDTILLITKTVDAGLASLHLTAGGHCFELIEDGAPRANLYFDVKRDELGRALGVVRDLVGYRGCLKACTIAYADCDAMVWRVFHPEGYNRPFDIGRVAPRGHE